MVPETTRKPASSEELSVQLQLMEVLEEAAPAKPDGAAGPGVLKLKSPAQPSAPELTKPARSAVLATLSTATA
jgi:hypothetical protein